MIARETPVTGNSIICIYGGRCVKGPHGIYMHKSLDFMSMTSERLRM
jgi:hypothetical protein